MLLFIASFLFCGKGCEVMRYSIKCEKCGRPADVEKQEFDEKRNEVKTVFKAKCECGGKVRALLD